MKILVTGGTGMVGNSLKKVLPSAIYVSSSDYDLRIKEQARDMFIRHSPDAVIHLAARVGGVKANTDYIADFYADNIMINANVLSCAKEFEVNKLVSLLSTCVYPDSATYPLTESQIHSGSPHDSNFGYAYAKRMLDVQSRALRRQHGCNFITAIPNNLFGENDNFHLEDSHVIPAIIRKIYEAKQKNENVVLWGDGSPLREFTYSRDLANILLFVLEHYDGAEPINVGNTKEVSINEVATIIADIMDFHGQIIWDTTKLSGQHRKPSDNSKLIELGWKQGDYTDLKNALTKTCKWVILNYPNLRGIV